jgi:thymidylate kinase
MIIELFGPPAVGKTTFAHALTSRLREGGHRARPVLSYRPSEPSSLRDFQPQGPITRHMKVTRRLLRPALELIAMIRDPLAFSHDVGVAGKLIRTLPPGNPISFARHLQYVSRLAHSWRQASARADIVVFDQGFVQEICSLALLDRTKDPGRIERALRMLPEPDLLIRLDAPRDVLEARLGNRQRGQSRMERMFELDKQKNLETADIVNRVHGLICRQGRQAPRFSSLDRHALEQVIELVELRSPPAIHASVQHA